MCVCGEGCSPQRFVSVNLPVLGPLIKVSVSDGLLATRYPAGSDTANEFETCGLSFPFVAARLGRIVSADCLSHGQHLPVLPIYNNSLYPKDLITVGHIYRYYTCITFNTIPVEYR